MPIINTSLQKGCTSYYMPEISKNEIAILKSNRGKKLIRIDSLHEDVQWLEFLTYYRPSCYGLFNKDNLHEVHEGPQYVPEFVQFNTIKVYFHVNLSYF